MLQERGTSLNSLGLGEIYSGLLPSSYCWKLTCAYRKETPDQDSNGEKILDDRGLNKFYVFRKGGQACCWDFPRGAALHWEFSDDGSEFILEENGAKTIYNVVDLGDRHLVIDGTRSPGEFVRLVYTRKEVLKGLGIKLDSEQKRLFREALKAQIRDLWDQIERLRHQLAAEREPQAIRKLKESISVRGEKIGYKKGMLMIIDGGVKSEEEGTGEELPSASAAQGAGPKDRTQGTVELSSLQAFLASVTWEGPPRSFPSYDVLEKVPALYRFDKDGVMWVAMKHGYARDLYQPVHRYRTRRRKWRVYSVNMEEASFKLTNVLLGSRPERNGLVKACTNFIEGYFVGNNDRRVVLFNRENEGYRFRIGEEGGKLSGWYSEYRSPFTSPDTPNSLP